jgi:putative colanic acid biosynthesis UDP-glucose lipid carrier transferase
MLTFLPMQYYHTNFNKALTILLDYLLLNLALIVVYDLSHHSLLNWVADKTYINIVVILNLFWLLSANIINLYQINFDYAQKIMIKCIKAFLFYVLLIGYVIFYLNNINAYYITRNDLVLSIIVFGVLFGISKYALVKSFKNSFFNRNKTRRVAIVGGGKTGFELYRKFLKNDSRYYQILGIFDDQPLKVQFPDLYLGDITACLEYVKANEVDEIFCALPFSARTTIERLIRESDKNMVRFKLIPEQYEYFQGGLIIKSLDKLDAFAIRVEPLENLSNRFFKRVFDILFSLFVLIFILSWLYPLIAILIKLESPGSVLFVQPRSGRNNHAFNCYKFRSMRINSKSDSLQAVKGDSRVTRIGAFLRKTSLDEMPQFFNVLIGNMSVVGPRPHMLSHTEEYSKLIDQFMVRHFIKPGITGWAQIQGLRGETKLLDDMRSRVEADVWYMENWNFFLDIRIILATFFKSITGDKYAY